MRVSIQAGVRGFMPLLLASILLAGCTGTPGDDSQLPADGGQGRQADAASAGKTPSSASPAGGKALPAEQSAGGFASAVRPPAGTIPAAFDFAPYTGATPTAESVLADLRRHNPEQLHPRLFASADMFAKLKENVKTDPQLRKWYADVKRSADKTLSRAVGTYSTPDGRRMPSAKDARPLIEQNAFVYRLSGEDKYAKRAVEEMMAMAAFPDWNDKKEFLNTAEMTAGMGIGYDWLYDYLTAEQRGVIRKAIVDKGLQKALDAHKAKAWWSVRADPVNNWSAVCNGGIIVGALAVGDEAGSVAGEAIALSLQSVQSIILNHLGPDGGWSEGPGYWRYMMEYAVSYMAALQSSVGTTYGHAQTTGLRESAYFPVYITGPQGTFNFADGDSGKMKIPELFWLARATNDPKLAGQRLAMMDDAKQGGGVYDMIWYDPKFRDSALNAPLDIRYKDGELATMRSKWNDPNAAFAGFKGGTAVASHSHSDIGEFVFQAGGEQWAIDPGKEDYNLPGYFNYDKERYTYYRLKPEGHNTLVINPGKQFQQDQQSNNPLDVFVSKARGAFAIADMQPAYARAADAARRGVMLADRKKLIVEDELQMKTPSTVWWFMHTKAAIQVAADGRSALLTQNGKRLWAAMTFPQGDHANASFQVMAAEPLPESPNPPGQTANTGIRKLAVKLEGVTRLRMAVELVPLAAGEPVPAAPQPYVPLAEWSVPD